MASFIDLTYDGSSDENAVSESSKFQNSKTRMTRQPLNQIQNNVQLPPIASVVSNIDLSPALTQALRKSSEKRVRKLLMRVCREHPAARALVEREFLVPKSEVVPYHADTESEDGGANSEEDSDDEAIISKKKSENDHAILPTPNLKRKAGSIDEELVPRFAKCENCKEEFDVTANERGDCIWHWGKREYCDDDGFWDDHDDDCHGDPWDLIDEPDYADGFAWDCCDRKGSEEGCKQTKHKTAGQPRKKSRIA